MARFSAVSNDHVGLEMSVETPENVILTYKLAGPAIRGAAYLVDALVRVIIMIAVMIGATVSMMVLPGFSIGLTLVVMFFNEWAYFVICEYFFDGRSIGKSAFNLRVVHRDGTPISFWASALRNVCRFIDAFMFYGVAIASMLCNRRMQRIGDLLGRTVVIQERVVTLPREPVIINKIAPLPREEINSYVPNDELLSLIDHFLGRRHLLTMGRGHALAWLLSRGLADRLNFQGDRKQVEEYPMAFLARVFVTFHRQDEEEQPRRSEPIPPAKQQRQPSRPVLSDLHSDY